ncbi:MAG TPA: ATP-grasp domain-containing protein [Pseudomonas sp.]|uniref:ATP-grasp domain-containing protein n=1 Tax=Pseudomonas sp. TaxID=306 RepID=UPI002C1087F4|nr:ATP-grasp domain-containing protein [Pseudomonas sp.]HSX89862.1 ATP-grasp domain-containing protein [Pseudomonas sp.]
MRLLYPSDPLDSKLPDESYKEEFDAALAAGISASLFSFEDFESGILKIRPEALPGETVLYRGWMLTPELYERLSSALHSKGVITFTNPDQYKLCHHLPEWYPHLTDLTSETIVLKSDANFQKELGQLNWPGFFIKDYVKSLNTAGGSLVDTPDQIGAVVQLIQKYRGQIEGGVCVRKRENYIEGTERRYFVLNGKPYAAAGNVPNIVNVCAQIIRSPFFSVDVVLRSDDVIRVVELGDGQVSDRKEWEAERFAQMLRAAG